MAGSKRKGCFLFYVYGYCLGLGTGIIAAILAWTETSPLLSRALLTTALGLSLVTLISQAVVTCDRCSSSRTLVRSVINIAGLSLTSVTTCAGTFFHSRAEGLFFLCGVLSTALYIMTCIAFSVNLVRERKRKNAQPSHGPTSQERRRRPSNSSTCLEVVARWMPADPYLGDPFLYAPPYDSTDQSERTSPQYQPTARATTISTIYLNPAYDRVSTGVPEGFHELTITQLALLGIPAGVSLPSYSEVMGVGANTNLPPPQYSEASAPVSHDHSHAVPNNSVTSAQSQNVTSSEPVDNDLPPRYDDLIDDEESTAAIVSGMDSQDGARAHASSQDMITEL